MRAWILCLLCCVVVASAVEPPADWRAERRAAAEREYKAAAMGDRWRCLVLLASDDPAEVQRGNAGLRDSVMAGSFMAEQLLIAAKKFPARLEPATLAYIKAQLGKELSEANGWPFPWTNWLKNVKDAPVPSNNQAYHAAAVGIVGGEILGRPDIVATARAFLRNLANADNQYGDQAEFNSPGYSTVSMTALAVIADCADDPESRLLARWQRDRLLLAAVSRYHAPTNQLCAPESRTYNDEAIGSNCIIATLLNDRILPDGVFFDGKLGDIYHVGHYSPFRMDNLYLSWEAPDYLRHLATNKPYPYEVCSTVYDYGWHWKREEDGSERTFKPGVRELTTYLTAGYALGSQSGMYQFQPDGLYFCACWPLAEKVTGVGDLRKLWSRMSTDELGPFGGEQKLFFRRNETYRTAQYRNKAIVLYHPEQHHGKPLTTGTLKMEVILTAFHPLGALMVGSQRVEMDKLPAVFPAPAPIYLDDGAVYAAILPLEVTNLGRAAAMTIVRTPEQQLIISCYNYQGAARTFSYKEWPTIRNGFAFEISEKREYRDFAAFRAHMAAARVSDALDGDVRQVVFTSGADTLRLHYNPVTETDVLREVNGQPVKYTELFRSPCAVLAAGGAMTLDKATLTWTPPTTPVWMLKDPVADTCAVWNLSPDTIEFTLATPKGSVTATGFGRGRLTVTGNAATVEQLPGAAAKVRTTGTLRVP